MSATLPPCLHLLCCQILLLCTAVIMHGHQPVAVPYAPSAAPLQEFYVTASLCFILIRDSSSNNTFLYPKEHLSAADFVNGPMPTSLLSLFLPRADAAQRLAISIGTFSHFCDVTVSCRLTSLLHVCRHTKSDTSLLQQLGKALCKAALDCIQTKRYLALF